MSTYRLDRLIVPHSLAVVCASPREASVGRHVVANLIAAGFTGPVHVVNPNYGDIEGISTVKSIDAIAGTPDVVVIAVPPAAVPETVAATGAKGAAAAIIITAGLGHGPGSLAEAADRAARATGLRLVGPNSLGVLVPPHFNASFAPRMPGKGDLAVISQSGAIVAGMTEWVAQRILAKWWPQARRPAADKTGSGNARLPARLGGLMFALAVRGRLWPPHVVP
jgi:acetyltransferase